MSIVKNINNILDKGEILILGHGERDNDDILKKRIVKKQFFRSQLELLLTFSPQAEYIDIDEKKKPHIVQDLTKCMKIHKQYDLIIPINFMAVLFGKVIRNMINLTKLNGYIVLRSYHPDNTITPYNIENIQAIVDYYTVLFDNKIKFTSNITGIIHEDKSKYYEYKTKLSKDQFFKIIKKDAGNSFVTTYKDVKKKDRPNFYMWGLIFKKIKN